MPPPLLMPQTLAPGSGPHAPLPPAVQLARPRAVAPAVHVEGQYFPRLHPRAFPAPSSTASHSTDSPTPDISPYPPIVSHFAAHAVLVVAHPLRSGNDC